MKILVLNCGSSSIKYKLFDMDEKQTIAQGGVERIGLPEAFIKITLSDGSKVKEFHEIPEHTAGIGIILNALINPKYSGLKSLQEIGAVGHRIVHGGEHFNKSTLITKEIIDKVTECNDLAPLHNPANLKGVSAIQAILPEVPQVAVFDTAFHQTMPDHAYMYGLPYEIYEKYAVRRYGFHGTSHRYVSKRACEILGLDYENSKLITAHIGNGGSITAIKNGKSIDTSMGMTPVEGLVMGTRVGDLDAGIAVYLMEKENLSPEELSELINKKSGLVGLSGLSSDMRDIMAAVAVGNKRAILAEKMFVYHILKYIGAYTAALNGVDAIVFTGGIGEHEACIRAEVCESLSYLGVEIDLKVNDTEEALEMLISTKESKVKVIVVPTDEEFMIASDTMELVL